MTHLTNEIMFTVIQMLKLIYLTIKFILQLSQLKCPQEIRFE